MQAFITAFVAALCMQTALLAGYMRHPVPAALLWIVAFIAVTRNVKTAGAGIRRRTRRRLRDALATIILVGGLLRFVVVQFPFWEHDRRGPGQATADAQKESDRSLDNSGDHTGVILLPERQQHTTLVPPLPSMRSELFDSKHQHPLSIPFYGAYWFFKPPDTAPPRDSYVTHGTPVQMSFFAPDAGPLIMEAKQDLDKLIDLACCREIRVEIENADRYPGTVAIELILVNTRPGQEGQVSLGSAPVTSAPGDPDSPLIETLTFPVPGHASIRQFDRLMIHFPRQRPRMNRSAKIAINRFVLVPRG